MADNIPPQNSPLRDGAIMAHELYLEFKNAGFSRREALELIARMFVTGAMSTIEDNDNNDD